MYRFFTFLCMVLISSTFGLTISKEKDNIKVIVDVLQSFNKSSYVVSNLCWTSNIKKKLAISLAESTNPIFIKFVKDIHAKDFIDSEKLIFLVDINCKESKEFLNKAALGKYFGRPYRWLIINNPNTDVIPSEIEEMYMLPDSEVYVMQFRNNSYIINLIYKRKPNRQWIIENYGHWSADRDLFISRHMDVSIAMRRKNLGQESIVTSMALSDNSSLDDFEFLRFIRNPRCASPTRTWPVFYVSYLSVINSFKHLDAVAKCGYYQMAPLYDFMNATRQIILTDAWGYYANGRWYGMLGHLAEGKAEIAGAVMFITKERMSIIDYMNHPKPATVKFIFREPPLSYQNNLYLLPFEASVWYCIGVFVVVLVIVMYANAYWDAKKEAGEKEEDTSMLVPKISDVTVFVMSAISQQGSNVELKGLLGRFVIFILFLVFLFLYTAYSASIVVLLQSSSNQIRTLTDLLNSKLELGVEDTPYNRYWFMNEKEPVRRAIYEKKVAPSGSKPKFFNLTEGVLQLQKKPFAFNTNLGSAYKVMEKYFFEHEKCGLQEIAYIQDNSPWQAVRKGSPYREIFKLGLLRNSEHGLNDRTNQIMYSKKPVCTVRGGSFTSVSLIDSYPIFLLLLYGMMLGIVLLLAEILHHRKILHCQIRKNSSRSGISGIIGNEGL